MRDGAIIAGRGARTDKVPAGSPESERVGKTQGLCASQASPSDYHPCGGCAPQQGLPDSIITCGCEVSACAQSGSASSIERTLEGFGAARGTSARNQDVAHLGDNEEKINPAGET
jgi:hypothetical protein